MYGGLGVLGWGVAEAVGSWLFSRPCLPPNLNATSFSMPRSAATNRTGVSGEVTEEEETRGGGKKTQRGRGLTSQENEKEENRRRGLRRGRLVKLQRGND